MLFSSLHVFLWISCVRHMRLQISQSTDMTQPHPHNDHCSLFMGLATICAEYWLHPSYVEMRSCMVQQFGRPPYLSALFTEVSRHQYQMAILYNSTSK